MSNTFLVILMIPLAMYLILRTPMARFQGRSTAPLDWASIAQGTWTLAFCLVEGAVPGRLGLSSSGLLLSYVIGLGVLSIPTIRRTRKSS